MIEVSNLSKSYGEHRAVDNISFTVAKGEVLGFLGQNGAGKSTTMKILTGFMPASEGTAKIGGFEVFENPIEVKKRVGYLPETPPVYQELLVWEYLSFVAQLRGIPKSQRKSKIDKALEKTSLTDVRKRLIGNLSKGYKQRVGLAQAIVHEPDVLILDEPTVGLDPRQVIEIRELIKGMRRDHTVIYSSHILSEVAATADRVLIINRGKIVAQEQIGKLQSAESTQVEIVVQKLDDRVLENIKAVAGVKGVQKFQNGSQKLIVEAVSNDATMAELSKVVVNSGAGLVKMNPVQQSLEEYYLSLIGGGRAQ